MVIIEIIFLSALFHGKGILHRQSYQKCVMNGK